jgi:FkbM family methyltransferase
MIIFYGHSSGYKNITDIALEKCVKGDILEIPACDNERAAIFGDPYPGILKHICIIDTEGNYTQYSADTSILYNIVLQKDEKYNLKQWWKKESNTLIGYEEKLKLLHKRVKIKYGSMSEEFPEQMMAIKFINPTDCVLEIGGNIGRNTVLISCILEKDENLVTLESHPLIADQLKENCALNNLNPHIEASALSKRKLIQSNWITIPSEVVLPGYIEVPTITYDALIKKYNKKFNVIVADCEGALYYILKDEPKILDNIETIIIENDFEEMEHKIYVDTLFANNGFRCVYNGELDITQLPKHLSHFIQYRNFFYQVWKR